MNFSYRLSNRKKLTIQPISDTHIGSKHFNQEYFEYMLEKYDLCTTPRMIYLGGDLLEVASKNVGDSAFKQVLSVNEQISTFCDLISPWEDEIAGMVGGNHDSNRMIKDYDFNPLLEVAHRLDIPFSSQILDDVKINGKTLKTYVFHGKGSAKRNDLAIGKVKRETAEIDANLILYSHLHRCMHDTEPIRSTSSPTGVKRKHYVLTGHYLKYKDSYADQMGIPILPEAFPRLQIGNKLDVNCTIDTIDVSRPDLFEL